MMLNKMSNISFTIVDVTTEIKSQTKSQIKLLV